MSTLLLIVLVLLVLGGGWGYTRFGYAGFSPAGLVVVILAVLFFTGRLHLR